MTDTEADIGPGGAPGPGPLPVDTTDMLWLIESRLVPGDADGLAGVRRAVRELIDDWDLDVVADDVVLVASELVANALRHGCTGSPEGWGGVQPGAIGPEPASATRSAALGVRHDERDLTLFVTDPSPEAPAPQPGDPLRLTGWGLELVAALSSTWGWTPGRWVGRRRPAAGPTRVGPGKTVWASFRLGPAVR